MSQKRLPEPHPSVFSTMQIPTPLVKYGQQGNPHYRYFYLSAGRSKLIWHSDKKKAIPTQISISSMLSLERGHKSPIFSKNKRSLHPEHLSFSVYYQLTNQREEKTLDVVCKDQIEYDNWVTGLMWLIENKEEITAAAHELEGPESTGRRGSLKIVDVENLRKEMNAHLDLCTWGNSAWGQLGHADKPDEIKDIPFPMKIRVLIDRDVHVKFVGCGESHTIAVAKTGECYGWGNAHSGRLGILPVGLKPDDSSNSSYPGIFDHVLVPQLIDCVRGVDTVACGSAHTLFALNDGRLFVTGCNISGQLGTGDRNDVICPREVVIPVSDEYKVNESDDLRGHTVYIAAGDQSSACIIDVVGGNKANSNRLLYTWGNNIYGGLGHGDNENCLIPTVVQKLADAYSVQSVVVGGFHMAAIAIFTAETAERQVVEDDDEEEDVYGEKGVEEEYEKGSQLVFTWGWGECGQLGHGNFTNLNVPHMVEFLKRKEPVKLSCGAAHTACILENDTEERLLYLWGASLAVTNDVGTTNIPTPFNVMIPKTSGSVIDVACGEMNTLFLTDLGFMHIIGYLPSSAITSRVESCASMDAKSIFSGARHYALLVGRKWVDDGDADKCMGQDCQRVFTFLFRGRHHCRSCGGIYCDTCSSKRAPVLKYGFHEKVRVCDGCYARITNGQVS